MNQSKTDNPLRYIADTVSTSFQAFFSRSFSTGVTIMAFVAIAMVWANTSLVESYHHFTHTPVVLQLGGVVLNFSLEHFVNDGLMVLFFLLVGLEIKREVLVGELSSTRKALLPMLAAAAGMAAPGLIYTVLNIGTPSARGWGVPVATDIAFALGILTLLGSRIPTGLKIFLAALAIVDDLLSVLVIALFYSGTLNSSMLWCSGITVVMLLICNRAGIYKMWVYIVLGVALWLFVLFSGIHATVAGVLLAMTIPARPRIQSSEFVERAKRLVDKISRSVVENVETLDSPLDMIHNLESQCEKVQPPLHRMERGLHNPVSFIILPLFALVNAGITLTSSMTASVFSNVSLGIILGLFVGKQIGISLAVWLSVKLKIADLPQHVTMVQIYGVSILCGIGFTMALFVAQLAFVSSEELQQAKLAIVIASALAAVIGSLVLKRSLPNDTIA